MTKVMIFINHSLALYKFRKELVVELRKKGYKVFVCYPNDEKDDYFESLGCAVIHFKMDRKSTNVFEEISAISRFKKICKRIKPDILLIYTLKCCLYSSFVSKKIKKIATVTGQSPFFKHSSGLKKIIYNLIVKRFSKFNYVFFQNRDDFSFFDKTIKRKKNFILVAGSGVNTTEHPYQGPVVSNPFTFSFVGRLVKEKGIYEFLSCIRKINDKNVVFNIAGPCEDPQVLDFIKDMRDSRINVLGDVEDINSLYKKSTCIVLPSYSEGMSNALLEAHSSGRPIICSNIPGCFEIIIPGITGLLVEPKDKDSLLNAMNVLLRKKECDLTEMGLNGRKYVVDSFSRDSVIKEYIEVVDVLAQK